MVVNQIPVRGAFHNQVTTKNVLSREFGWLYLTLCIHLKVCIYKKLDAKKHFSVTLKISIFFYDMYFDRM